MVYNFTAAKLLIDSGYVVDIFSAHYSKISENKLSSFQTNKKNLCQPFLTDKEFYKGCKELDRLTSSFPAVMKDLEQPQRRGMRR